LSLLGSSILFIIYINLCEEYVLTCPFFFWENVLTCPLLFFLYICTYTKLIKIWINAKSKIEANNKVLLLRICPSFIWSMEINVNDKMQKQTLLILRQVLRFVKWTITFTSDMKHMVDYLTQSKYHEKNNIKKYK